MMLADLKPRVVRLFGDPRWEKNKTVHTVWYDTTKKKRVRRGPDLTCQKFGRWTVVSCAGYDRRLEVMKWNCVCACGKRKAVSTGSLRFGNSTSCGCGRRKHAC